MAKFIDENTTQEIFATQEEWRKKHSHWPLLDQISIVLYNHYNDQLQKALTENPLSVLIDHPSFFAEIVERAFWLGHEVGKRGFDLEECTKIHMAPQQRKHN